MILNNVFLFLVTVLFELAIFACLLRVLLQSLKADFYNPICQLLVTVTNPVVQPLRRIMPRVPYLDLASSLVLLVLTALKLYLTGWLKIGVSANILPLFLWAFFDIFNHILNIFFYAIIARILIGWLNPTLHNPLTSLIITLSEPILAPCRRAIPLVAHFDLSPLVAILSLKLIEIAVTGPLLNIAAHWALT